MSFFCAALVLILATYSVEALDNGLALTPPMGWLSWVRFTCNIDCNKYPDDCINSRLYQEMADHLAQDGYAQLGYMYVNIDDCWSEMHRKHPHYFLAANSSRFPGGIVELAKYVHSKGLKLGIYGDCGTKTCAGYPAQLKTVDELSDNFFDLDAWTFADWKVDSFKFDGCYLDPKLAESVCPSMTEFIIKNERPILVICEWPFYMLRERYELRANLQPDFELAQKSCNAWRYYEDVEDSWLSILSIVDFTVRIQNTIVKYHGPGHWFDPDQLVIGNFGLSPDQARAQMALWCIWSAPLYMSNDLRNIDPDMAAILKNKKLIEVDQDRLGVFGLMVASQENNRYQAFVKPVEPIIQGCPSFVIVYLSRQTLGDKKFISFQLRPLLTRVPFDIVDERYSTLPDAHTVNLRNCKDFLESAMTKDPSNDQLLNQPVIKDGNSVKSKLEFTQVRYYVIDLFGDEPRGTVVGLNENLTLKVNPSGVRAVKLVLP